MPEEKVLIRKINWLKIVSLSSVISILSLIFSWPIYSVKSEVVCVLEGHCPNYQPNFPLLLLVLLLTFLLSTLIFWLFEKKHWLTKRNLLLGAIVLFLVAFLVYFLYPKIFGTTTVTYLRKSNEKASSSAKTDPIANWKTYNVVEYVTTQNPQNYRFSIKYPPDWQSKAFLYFMSPDYHAPLNSQDSTYNGADIQIVVSEAYKDNSSTLMEYFNSSFKDARSSGPPPNHITPININIDALGKVEGIQYDQKVAIAPPNSTTHENPTTFENSVRLEAFSLGKLFIYKDIRYEFILTSKDESISYVPILDRMISTFKFTN